MDIRQLRYFLGVLEAKSFTKAAESLYVAQPALGVQIRKLEQELGVSLLVRHSRGVAPTEAGAELAKHAETLLRDFERMRQSIVDIGDEPGGKVSLGVTTSVMHLLASDLVESCLRKYPNVLLNITEGMSRRLTEWITEDRLDVALTYFPPPDSNSDSKPLAEESLYFVVPSNHPAAAASEIALSEVLGYDLVFSSRWPSLFRPPLEQAANAKGVELRVVCEADSVSMIREMVRNGLGCAVLPYGAVRWEVKSKDLAALRIADPPITRTLYMTQSRKRTNSKALDSVCDEIQTIVADRIAAGSFGWGPPLSKSNPRKRPKAWPRDDLRMVSPKSKLVRPK